MTDHVEEARKLVAYKVTSKRLLMTGKGSVENTDLIGGHIPVNDGESAYTAKGTFTVVGVDHPELGHLAVWFSYDTPIAVRSVRTNLLVLSHYSYSKTTQDHQAKIRRGNSDCDVLTVYDHVAQGMTYEDVLQEKVDFLNMQVQKVVNARKSGLWADNVRSALTILHYVASILHPDFSPSVKMPVMSDALVAKLTAWRMHNPQVASVLTKLEELDEKADQQERVG